MTSDLRACLDGYREAGQLDSSGDFTLSQAHAEKKLQDFRLPEPRLYVLNLVASAVAGQASYVNFRTDADELWMETDHVLPDVRDLETLHSILFSNQANVGISELAIGLNGLLPLKPEVARLEASDHKRTAVLEWDGKRFGYQEVEMESPPVPGMKLHIKERLGFRVARKFAAKISGGMLPDSEEDAIFRYCNRSPIPISFNEKSVVRTVVLGKTKQFTFTSKPFPVGHPLKDVLPCRPSPGNFCGILAREGRLAPWVTLVVHGVNFRLPEHAFQGRGREGQPPRGIVYADFLRKDLSQVGLVQDKTFEKLIEDVQDLATRYL
jgi:hypothetical protein